jgi:RNA polymerase sigma-70 factor (ECF subfamily)
MLARAAEFERLVGRARRRAGRFALMLTHNRDDADDLVQDALVRAWRGFDSYCPEGVFANWVLRIMQRTFIDARRRDNPIRRAASLDALASNPTGSPQEIQIFDPAQSPLDSAVADGLREELIRTVRRLPEPYRTALVLHDAAHLSYAEIAVREGTTLGTVRSRIHRGRRMLRERMSRRWLTR